MGTLSGHSIADGRFGFAACAGCDTLVCNVDEKRLQRLPSAAASGALTITLRKGKALQAAETTALSATTSARGRSQIAEAPRLLPEVHPAQQNLSSWD